MNEQDKTLLIPTRKVIRATEVVDLDYRVHALSAAISYHRDVSRWDRAGRVTTNEEDRAFTESNLLDTANLFEAYLRQGWA